MFKRQKKLNKEELSVRAQELGLTIEEPKLFCNACEIVINEDNQSVIKQTLCKVCVETTVANDREKILKTYLHSLKKSGVICIKMTISYKDRDDKLECIPMRSHRSTFGYNSMIRLTVNDIINFLNQNLKSYVTWKLILYSQQCDKYILQIQLMNKSSYRGYGDDK